MNEAIIGVDKVVNNILIQGVLIDDMSLFHIALSFSRKL